MKIASGIILFLFMLFLSTPTIVSMIEKGTDTSLVFSASEEELTHKDLKAEIKIENYEFINVSGNIGCLIRSENLSRQNNVFSSVFIPPPKHS